MKKKKKDKERDIALQTPEKGKKSNEQVSPPRSGTDEEKTLKKGPYNEPDEGESDAQGAHGMGNKLNKGEQGAQGYGKYKK